MNKVQEQRKDVVKTIAGMFAVIAFFTIVIVALVLSAIKVTNNDANQVIYLIITIAMSTITTPVSALVIYAIYITIEEIKKLNKLKKEKSNND